MNKCEHCGARWGFGDNQWIDVIENPPKKMFQECLIFYENAHHEDIHYSEDGIMLAEYEGNYCFRENGGKIIRPLWWLPLPSTDSIPSTMKTKED